MMNTSPVVSPQQDHLSAERFEKIVAVVTVFTPLLFAIGAVFLLWGRLISATDLVLLGSMYVFTGLGVTLGFHRLFTHRSFQCVAPIKLILGVAGSMAAEGPLLFWVAVHRKHHKTSDEADDPHSPHHYGGGLRGTLLGCWHAHMGWMLTHKPERYARLVPDLLRDRMCLFISRRYFSIIFLGVLLPGVVGGLISHRWFGFFSGMLWGGAVRLFLVHHATWSINSLCHLFGSRSYETGDESRNNALCAVVTLGEGWHNNHHAFPASARHGLRWWQVDGSYLLVQLMKLCGLAWDVRLPDVRSLARKQLGKGGSIITAAEPSVLPVTGVLITEIVPKPTL